MSKGISTFKMTAVGSNTLIMHSCQLANPLNPLTKKLKAITSKRKKTDEDIEAISQIEFEGGCYWDDELGLYIPAENLEACLCNGAKVNKNGKKAKLAIRVIEPKIKLRHDAQGKSLTEIYHEDNGKYQDNRFVVVNRARVLRCRPRFDRWGFECTVQLDETIMTQEEFQDVVSNAGATCCLGDIRPRYGSFEARLEQLS